MSVIKKFRITKIKNSKPLVSLKKISLSFQKNHLILDNINLDISKGQITHSAVKEALQASVGYN